MHNYNFHFTFLTRRNKLAKQKTVADMSSSELYDLALRREQEEKEQERQMVMQQASDLKAKRRALAAEYNKKLRGIDAEIQALTGRKRRKAAAPKKGKTTDRILQIILDQGQISTKDLRAALETEGVEVSNLSQLLANLKKSGRVVSPSRAVYAIA